MSTLKEVEEFQKRERQKRKAVKTIIKSFKEEIADTNVTDAQQLNNLYYHLNPNGHWFDKKTMKFFKTRVSDKYIKTVNKIVYFIASNRFDMSTPRTYKLQSLNLVTGRVESLSPTEGETQRAAIEAFNNGGE